MFGKTKEKFQAAYVEPVQKMIATAIILSVLAIFIAVIALGKVL